MRNKITFASLLVVYLSGGCTKAEKVDADKVIFNIYVSNKTPDADGTGTVDVSVQLDPGADDDKRNVIFHTTSGMFLGSKDTIITQKAEYTEGKLYAFVKLVIPNSPGPIYLTAKPAIATKFNNFVLKDTLISQPVAAKSISLSSSSLAVSANFSGEVLITGTLKNNGNVSAGNKVVFEDDLSNGDPANGRYRQLKISSDASSTVSTYYSPSDLPIGTDVYIKCTVLDANGQKTNIQDVIKIAIIPHF